MRDFSSVLKIIGIISVLLLVIGVVSTERSRVGENITLTNTTERIAIQVCIPNSTACRDKNYVKACKEDGSGWIELSKYCYKGCINGSCIECSDECIFEGWKDCRENNVVECRDWDNNGCREYKVVKVCEYRCEFGECKQKPIVVEPTKPITPLPHHANLTAHFIDVGQGDSILITTPNRTNILIDCGDRGKQDIIFSYLNKEGVDRIDILITTHPDSDHIGSCDDVLRNFDVKQVWDNGQNHTTSTYRDYIDLAKQRNYEVVTRNYAITLDSARLEVLSPPQPLVFESLNDNSVVIRLSFGDIDFLFAGDCEEPCEQNILDSGLAVHSEILKVGHHGSHTATSLNFLIVVNPDVGVISVGVGNRYGHPRQVTLDRLTNEDIKIYRTDLQGDIVITTDGLNYSVTTEKYASESDLKRGYFG